MMGLEGAVGVVPAVSRGRLKSGGPEEVRLYGISPLGTGQLQDCLAQEPIGDPAGQLQERFPVLTIAQGLQNTTL